LFFLFSPGSWVFHSHHTESLFLLLSFTAFLASRKGKWQMAALLAGLCALTRNQGVFVAIAVALDGALQRKDRRERLLIIGCGGLISALLFACYTAYQYLKVGDPVAFAHAHQAWNVVDSVYGYFGTLWFANSWQGTTWATILHHLFFILLNGAVIGLLWKREFALALYIFLSEWVQLSQGHLENAFRFGAVLFPALFFVGDMAGRLPQLVRWALLIGFLVLNLMYAQKYALGEWAY
jgi:hypothetical protein